MVHWLRQRAPQHPGQMSLRRRNQALKQEPPFRETLRDLFVGRGGWYCWFSFCSSFASSLLGWHPFPGQVFRFPGALSAVRGFRAVCDVTRREPLRSALLGISGGSCAGALSSGRRAFSGFGRRGGRGGQGTESRDLLGAGPDGSASRMKPLRFLLSKRGRKAAFKPKQAEAP